jgi:hypothetical protein
VARQYIGPKVQAHVPDEYANWIKEEAKRRGVPEADVVREVIASGMLNPKRVAVSAGV